jgi:alpha-L-fucosidase 2
MGTALKKASGENKNPFFRVEEIPAPVISPKATITTPQLKESFIYDLQVNVARYLQLFQSSIDDDKIIENKNRR